MLNLSRSWRIFAHWWDERRTKTTPQGLGPGCYNLSPRQPQPGCRSCRQMKPLMENARAHQKHQYLINGNARPLIHRFNAVEKINDLPPIEVWNGSKHVAAERVLHQ